MATPTLVTVWGACDTWVSRVHMTRASRVFDGVN